MSFAQRRRRPPLQCHYPCATIDRLLQLKSPIADWNSEASSNKETRSSANYGIIGNISGSIQRFFLGKLETPVGEY